MARTPSLPGSSNLGSASAPKAPTPYTAMATVPATQTASTKRARRCTNLAQRSSAGRFSSRPPPTAIPLKNTSRREVIGTEEDLSAHVGYGDRSGIALRLVANSLDLVERVVGGTLGIEVERCRVVLAQALEQVLRGEHLV